MIWSILFFGSAWFAIGAAIFIFDITREYDLTTDPLDLLAVALFGIMGPFAIALIAFAKFIESDKKLWRRRILFRKRGDR